MAECGPESFQNPEKIFGIFKTKYKRAEAFCQVVKVGFRKKETVFRGASIMVCGQAPAQTQSGPCFFHGSGG